MRNKVELIGRIGDQPDSKKNPSTGKHIVNYSMATTETYLDKKTDQYVEKTEWHSLVSFDKTADYVDKHVKKGDLYLVEGKLQAQSWEDNGQPKRRTVIVVNHLQKLPKYFKRNESDSGSFNEIQQASGQDFDPNNI